MVEQRFLAIWDLWDQVEEQNSWNEISFPTLPCVFDDPEEAETGWWK